MVTNADRSGQMDTISTEMKDTLKKIKGGVRITKIVCTRSVKGRNGDTYVGFSAAWDTIQDDAGGGADQITALDEIDAAKSLGQGLSLRESRMAALVLGMQVDIAAHDQALAGGNLSMEQRTMAVRSIKANYARLMTEMFGTETPNNVTEESSTNG
jgi:hypothetical protein